MVPYPYKTTLHKKRNQNLEIGLQNNYLLVIRYNLCGFLQISPCWVKIVGWVFVAFARPFSRIKELDGGSGYIWVYPGITHPLYYSFICRFSNR